MRGWIGVEFVQVRVRPNVVLSVPYEDRSRAADGVIRLLRGAIAGYSLGERGETVAFENELVRSSSRKTFIWGWIWVEFVQVRVRPNMVLSVPYVDRSRAAAGASAFYGERLRDIVSYVTVANRTILGMERYLQVFSPSSAVLTTHSRQR